MHIKHLSPQRFRHTILWALLLSALIVGITATLARASYNVSAALTDKPDIAIYLLLPDEGIGETTLIRGDDLEREYLAQTKNGPEMIRIKRGEHEWYLADVEQLH